MAINSSHELSSLGSWQLASWQGYL